MELGKLEVERRKLAGAAQDRQRPPQQGQVGNHPMCLGAPIRPGGQLGPSARVVPAQICQLSQAWGGPLLVIEVTTYDARDEADVWRVRQAIRALGIAAAMTFLPNPSQWSVAPARARLAVIPCVGRSASCAVQLVRWRGNTRVRPYSAWQAGELRGGRWRRGRNTMHLSGIEMLEAEQAIRAIGLSYSPDDALPILVAIAEMVADGELTSGADLVAALEVFLEDDDDEA